MVFQLPQRWARLKLLLSMQKGRFQWTLGHTTSVTHENNVHPHTRVGGMGPDFRAWKTPNLKDALAPVPPIFRLPGPLLCPWKAVAVRPLWTGHFGRKPMRGPSPGMSHAPAPLRMHAEMQRARLSATFLAHPTPLCMTLDQILDRDNTCPQPPTTQFQG